MSVNGDIALTPEECYTGSGAQTGVYCPFHIPDGGSAPVRGAGECAVGDGDGSDVIQVNIRGTIQLDYALPAIRRGVRIVGLGPDQTIISGNATNLARINRPDAVDGSLDSTIDVPIFTVNPSIAGGAQVVIEDLTVQGRRIHYFRSASASAAGCDAVAGGGNPDCVSGDPTPGACDNVANNGTPDCATPATEPNKRIINFGGIYMDNGGNNSEPRKQLSLVNSRFNCNRRGAGSNVGGKPDGTVASNGEAPTATAPGPHGGAVTLLGRAALDMSVVSFNNNIADVGSGGAIFGGSKDNASPSLTMSGSNSVFNSTGSCQDVVFATDGATNSNNLISCNGGASQSLFCPSTTTAFTSYAPGNLAGSDTATGGPAALPGAAVGGRNGGAIAIDASITTLGNIGHVDIQDTHFQRSKAAGRGGAVSLINVTSSNPAVPAFMFNNVLFGGAAGSGNQALADGGAVFIQGHQSTATSADLQFTSFGDNSTGGKGGGLYYVTQPGAPIDFTMVNTRFANNSASLGGAVYAEDNTVDDSGLLNINKATFNGNVATTDGGAIHCGATKGGSQLTNLTISGNVADRNGGGIYVGSRCHLDINSSTIVNNRAEALPTGGQGLGITGGGGIFVDAGVSQNGRVDMRNTILALNQAIEINPDTMVASFSPDNDSGADCSAADNAVLRSAGLSVGAGSGNNFVGSVRGCGPGNSSARPFLMGRNPVDGTCVNPSPQTGDWVGAWFDNRTTQCITNPTNQGVVEQRINPVLRVLADNGGPTILGAHNFTHIPDTGSPIINAGGTPECRDGLGNPITEDEREAARGTTQTGRCDIGAVEVNSPTVPSVTVVALPTFEEDDPPFSLSPTQNSEIQMMHLRMTAPADINVVVNSLRIRGEVAQFGTGGEYTQSVVGMRIYRIDDFGNRIAQLYTSGGTRPNDLRVGGFTDAVFTTPLSLSASESVDLEVTYVFATSSQLAQVKSSTLLAAAGLGVLPLFGLAGVGRRRLYLAAAAAVAITLLGGCDSDGPATSTPGGTTGAERTFRAGVTRVDYSAGTQPVMQGVSVQGDTVVISPN